jgi:hypothetical protein
MRRIFVLAIIACLSVFSLFRVALPETCRRARF